MKKEIKGFIIGSISTICVLSGAAFAASNFVSIDVVPGNVNVYVNDKYVDTPNFTYDDSTYTQIRPVLESAGCTVEYDEHSKSVKIDAPRIKPYTVAWIDEMQITFGAYDTYYDLDTGDVYVNVDVMRDLGFIVGKNQGNNAIVFYPAWD